MNARERKPKKLDREALKEYALRSLSGRAHSLGELRQKMRQKAADPADIAGIIDELKSAGYLNDREYANSFAAARKENQGFGRGRVFRDLLARRVAPAVAQKAVGEAFESADEVVMIENYLARKFRAVSLSTHLKDPKHLAAAYRRLRLAGFSSGNSIRVLKRYADQAEQLEGMEDSE